MTYLIRTKFGATYEVSEKTRASLNKIILQGRDTRPQFIEITELNLTLNTDSIAVIEPEGISGKKEACEV